MTFTKKEKRDGLASLREALSNDIGLFTADDFEAMDELDCKSLVQRYGDFQPKSGEEFFETALEELDSTVLQTLKSGQGIDLLPCDVVDATTEHPANDWILPRRSAVEAVWDVVLKNPVTVLKGPASAGKSTFWRHNMRLNFIYREHFDASLLCDCFALQGRSKRKIERDAVYMQLGRQDQAFSSFLSGVADEERPFQTLMMEKFHQRRGILVLDHVECLARTPEVKNWLNELILNARSLEIPVLLIYEPGQFPDMLDQLIDRFPSVELPPVTVRDIDDWIGRDRFVPHRREGLKANEVYRSTGGLPRLIRDFGRYLEQAELNGVYGDAALKDFENIMVEIYSPEVEQLLNVSAVMPWNMRAPLQTPGNSNRRILTNTGIIHESGYNGLAFVSRIVERRYQRITLGQTLSLQALSGPDAIYLENLKFQEIVANRVRETLMLDTQPISVWKRASMYFCHLGLENLSIHIRDRTNSKVWMQVYSTDRRKRDRNWRSEPLYADNMPNFAHAVQIGRIVMDAQGRVFIPLIAADGRVGIVLRGEFADSYDTPFKQRLMQRRIWRFAKAIEPAIALGVERAHARRAERHWREATYRVLPRSQGDHPRDIQPIVQEAKCAAVVIFERGDDSWSLICADVPDETDEADPLKVDSFTFFDPAGFDEITDLKSRRGRVITNGQVWKFFPRLRGTKECAAFAWPVPGKEEDPTRLVVFIFRDEQASELTGPTPVHLKLIAARAAAVA